MIRIPLFTLHKMHTCHLTYLGYVFINTILHINIHNKNNYVEWNLVHCGSGFMWTLSQLWCFPLTHTSCAEETQPSRSQICPYCQPGPGPVARAAHWLWTTHLWSPSWVDQTPSLARDSTTCPTHLRNTSGNTA